MDPLSEALDHLRSSGALVGRNLLSPPWSLRFADDASITLVSFLRGDGWVLAGEGEPIRIGQRERVLITGARPFAVASDREGSVAPLYVLAADGHCLDQEGRRIPRDSIALGTRTCGDDLDAEHALLSGSFRITGRIAERLLDALPRVLVTPPSAEGSGALALLEAELTREAPGQRAVLDRMLELALVETLREWFALSGTSAPRWYRAGTDRIVAPALRAIHADPARAWTVGRLAREASVSRAAFARRFAELMGEGPISYLTGWRLCLASDLLTGTDDTLDAIAERVGYASPYALSTAFLREYGQRPSRYRAAARPTVPAT